MATFNASMRQIYINENKTSAIFERKMTMKKLHILCWISILIFTTLGFSQGSKQLSAADQAELTQFRTYIQQHPHALAALKANPAQISTKEFSLQFRGVGEYLAAHPHVATLVKASPGFFDKLTPTNAGGGDGTGGSNHHKGWF